MLKLLMMLELIENIRGTWQYLEVIENVKKKVRNNYIGD
jgi:hypothetical protein